MMILTPTNDTTVKQFTETAEPEEATEVVESPLPEDILCGKDKRCMTHPGSLFFKRIIDSNTTAYRTAATRQGKMAVTKSVFDLLQSRRFLKLNEDTKQWEVLHSLCIRDKIGHALRFANRKSKSKTALATASKKRSMHASPSEGSCTSMSSTSTSGSEDSFSDNGNAKWTGASAAARSSTNLFAAFTSPLVFPQSACSSSSSDATACIDSTGDSSDLSWMMQLPIMEVNPANNQIYFAPKEGSATAFTTTPDMVAALF